MSSIANSCDSLGTFPKVNVFDLYTKQTGRGWKLTPFERPPTRDGLEQVEKQPSFLSWNGITRWDLACSYHQQEPAHSQCLHWLDPLSYLISSLPYWDNEFYVSMWLDHGTEILGQTLSWMWLWSYFLDEISNWIIRLSKADDPPPCAWASSNQLNALIKSLLAPAKVGILSLLSLDWT